MKKQKKIKLKQHLFKSLQEVVFNLEFSQEIIRLLPDGDYKLIIELDELSSNVKKIRKKFSDENILLEERKKRKHKEK
jgi:hypothetical protein